MMVQECMGTCEVLFLDCGSACYCSSGPIRGTCNHVNRTKHMAGIGRLSQVACYFPSFMDVRGRRKGWCNADLR
jgi:hypothetical protein